MALGVIIGSIAMSYIANNIPEVRALWKSYQGIDGHIDTCFESAKKQFFKNEDISQRSPVRYVSFAAFSRYLSRVSQPDKEAEQFMALLEKEFQGDSLCANLLTNWKIDQINELLQQHLSTARKYQKSFSEISSNLKAVDKTIKERYHIARQETFQIYNWIVSESKHDEYLDRVAIVTGQAGCGKTVVLSDLVVTLEEAGIPVIGLKSDYLFDSNETDIDKAVNIGGQTLLSALEECASAGLTVLVIDQVDALSLSLTMRRKPLAEIQRVVKTAAENPNIRVVLSCREYDFKNERNFERYSTCKQFRIGKLSKEGVDITLTALGIPLDGLTKIDYDFLEIPLNLSLFCRLWDSKKNTTKPTSHSLYGVFWKYNLEDLAQETGIRTEKIIEYLTMLTDTLIKEQVLTISWERFGSIWNNEQSFLLSTGFLTINAEKTRIQFFHQTLFDYTIARLFIENHRSIDTAFEGIHQGLFLRGRLKRILEYLRGVSESDYAKSIKTILGLEDSKTEYRFHLKQLVISLLGSQESLLPCEIAILKNDIFPKELLLNAFRKTVFAKGPSSLLVEYIYNHGGISCFPPQFANTIFSLLQYLFASEKDWVIDSLRKINISGFDTNVKSSFIYYFNSFPISSKKDVELLLPFANLLDNNLAEFPLDRFYKNIAEYSIEVVSNRLYQYFSEQLRIWRDNSKKKLWEFEIPFEVKWVLEKIQEVNPQKHLQLSLDIFDLLLASSEIEIETEIKSSSFYYMYNRQNDSFSFPSEQLDNILDAIETAVEESWDGIDSILSARAKTNYAENHIVAIVGWLKKPDYYKQVSLEYLKDNILKEEHSSILNYYQIELFRETFPYLDAKAQKALIDIAMRVNPPWEKTIFKGYTSDRYPDTSMGKTKAKFLATIPEALLKEHFRDAWSILKESERKGFYLDNEAPNKVQVMSGWPTFSDAEFDKMKPSDFINLAEKYGEDDSTDNSRPTRVGNAWAMKKRAKNKPDEFFNIYLTLIRNKRADLYYVSSGLSSLLEGGLDKEKTNTLYAVLIDAIGSDVNSTSSAVVMDICRSLDYFIKKQITAPEVLMNYVIHVVNSADDSTDDEGENTDYDTGINRVRGCAAYYLVGCSFMEPFRESIFVALERLSTSAAVATRCAALFRMAYLASYDKERTMRLFLAITADYNDNILRLPAHNLNPLNLLIRYDFSRLIPYFEQSIDKPKTHRSNIPWLWFATIRDEEGAKELLFKVGDSSVEGRSSIVKCTQDYYQKNIQSLVEEALYRYLSYDEKELGRIFDFQFDHLKKWPPERVLPFLNDFFKAPVVTHCSYKVYRYMKQYADIDPKTVLVWLMTLYPYKKDADMEQGEILDVLYTAYNKILTFDKSDKDLEIAMDLLDSFLMSKNESLSSMAIKKLGNE